MKEAELEDEMTTNGTTIGLCNYINDSLDIWKTKKINIAVSGNSGAGKSSLINALRHMKPSDKGAAKVGVTEMTLKSINYEFPKNDRIVLWDLPGLGTQNCPRDTYFEDQKMSEYDVVIVVTSTRFFENNIWLAKKCLEDKKSVLFVRTKIDFDTANQREDYPDGFMEEECLNSIRNDIAKNLCKAKIPITDDDVYLVNSRNRAEYDFSKLEKKFKELLKVQGKAIHAILREILESAIEKKRDLSKTEFTGRKALSVVTGFLPLPYLETSVGNSSKRVIRDRCLEKFCLDEKSLERFCKKTRKDTDKIKGQLKSYEITPTEEQSQYETTDGKKYSTFWQFAKYTMPAIGSFVAAYQSYKNTDTCLDEFCEKFAADELKLVEIRLQILEEELRVL